MSGQTDTALAKHKTAVIVGRWQTPYLHEGHKHLINTACMHEGIRDLFIIIGCQEEVDERNPYTFKHRKDMILREYPMALIGIIWDVKDDNIEWSRKLDEMIEQMDRPLLFGSRDSFHQHYKGRFSYYPVDEIPGISATKIREGLNFKEPRIVQLDDSAHKPCLPPDGTGLRFYMDTIIPPNKSDEPIKRVFKLNPDGIDMSEIEPFVNKFLENIKKTPFIDPDTGDYNLRYNILNTMEDIYIPIRNKDKPTYIETKLPEPKKKSWFQRIKEWFK